MNALPCPEGLKSRCTRGREQFIDKRRRRRSTPGPPGDSRSGENDPRWVERAVRHQLRESAVVSERPLPGEVSPTVARSSSPSPEMPGPPFAFGKAQSVANPAPGLPVVPERVMPALRSAIDGQNRPMRVAHQPISAQPTGPEGQITISIAHETSASDFFDRRARAVPCLRQGCAVNRSRFRRMAYAAP